MPLEVSSRVRRVTAGVLTGALMVTALPAITPVMASAAAANFKGSLSSVTSVEPSGDNQVNITFDAGGETIQGRMTFLEDGIIHYVVDPTGQFAEYATPNSSAHTARIQAQPDSSDVYDTPAEVSVNAEGDAFTITADGTTVSLDKDTALMTISDGENVVMQETAPIKFQGNKTVQTLSADEGENFFGGGTQNGRFLHTGDVISIANTNNWVDGGVASPNPFYWSSDGYGVLRNTFAQGSYDFGSTTAGTVTATHNDNKYDAYIFTSEAGDNASVAQDLLTEYFTVTGDPVLLPEYAFYLGHLNAYNRDGWSDTQEGGGKAWTIKGSESASSAGTTTYEYGMADGYVVPDGHTAESLNGPDEVLTESAQNYLGETPYEYSARAVIDEYGNYDMPFGWFLPNDGYGAGYGHNGYQVTGGVSSDGSSSAERLAAVAANVENLGAFSEYANANGVETGLWTQSNLTPDSNNGTPWQKLRDFQAEVETGGVAALKTDVAWVGSGYSFGLNGTKQAYDIVTTTVNKRPNIVTLDGWAGTQRFGAIWTGDQTGGQWEYIRFHIPTYIGQSLSGNPNIGSDMDGIFGGSALISTRDYQWKTFTPLMLDMDGWGTYAKAPYTHGDPYTGISRMYLKLKAQLMPYIYTSAASAANVDGWTGNDDNGLPMIRAMLLEDDSAYAASEATQYQYMFGGDFLVAPIYQDTQADDMGNDVRNNIYLPGDEDTIWIDYWSGEQYRGGQVINGYDAPLWKLPLFVKANAIVPMYEENNNPKAVTDTNPDGLDKTQRVVDFYPVDGENSYVSYEDDGISITNKTVEDESYGIIDNISYNGHVETKFTSKVDGNTATLTAEPSTGDYDGYDSNRSTTFKVSVSAKPESIVASNGQTELKVTEVEDKAAFDAATPEAGEAIYFYDESPALETYAPEEEEEFAEMVADVHNSPKVYVKFAEIDVQTDAQTLVINGFANEGDLGANTLNPNLGVPQNVRAPEETTTPTSIQVEWDPVDGATSYEIKVDGTLNSVGDATSYVHSDLAYNSTHTYEVRARNAEGYSEWTEPSEFTSALDPWRNTPVPVSVDWTGNIWGNHNAGLAFDHVIQTGDGGFHSNNGGLNELMTIDYGMVYQFEDFDYYQRDDAGNGTVTQMKIEWSLDGNTWEETTVNFEANGKMQTVDFLALNDGQPIVARYIRLTALESVGTFFSAAELAFNIVDGTEGFELGSTVSPGTVGEEDYGNLNNYKGVENHGTTADTFESQIVKGYGDINGNGAYDVYDYAYTMFKLDGGTKQEGDVSGSIALIPSANSVKQGDVITVDLYASGATNVNAYGSLVHFNSSDFEFVENSITQNAYTGTMENLSISRDFGDGITSVNLAFANRGDKDLYSGTDVLASFQLRALKDVDNVALESTSWLIGPAYDTVEVVDDGSGVVFPDVPQVESAEYAQDAFDITITNEALPETDDGTNVTLISQSGTFDQLFDNVKYHDGSAGTGVWEFKWNGNEYTVFPTTMHFDFKQASPLSDVVVTNRVDASGTVGGNGYIKSIEATLRFEDGTTETFSGGDYDTSAATYTFAPSAENADKLVAGIDITYIDASNSAAGCLTVSEIDFNYETEGVSVDRIELGDNETELYTGELSRVDARAVTTNDAYPYVTVESSDASVVSTVATTDADGNIAWFIRGNRPGKATIKVYSPMDEEVSESYEVTVLEGVDTSALTAALQAAGKYSSSAYTEDSYAKLDAAVKAAQELLETEGYTANDVAEAVTAIEDAIEGLAMRPVDEDTLINTSADSGVTFVSASSEATYEDSDGSKALDYNNETHWHSDWAYEPGVPQWIIFDLGAVYDLTDVTILPRQTGNRNGNVFEAEIVVAASSADLEAYAENGYVAPEGNTAVSLGAFEFDNDGIHLTDRSAYQQMAFAATSTQYVMIKVNHCGGDSLDGADSFCSIAEARFYGTKTGGTTPTVDKTALQELVNTITAKDLKAEDYTEATWTPFANALADAQRLLDDADATQTEVDQAKAALETAYNGLEKTEIPPVETPDKSELEALVNKVKDTDTSAYTEETATRFKNALAGAQTILDKEDATQEEIYAAWNELKEAFDGLAKPVVDKSALEAYVAQVKDTDVDAYTDETAAAFSSALKAAQSVLDKDDATQDEVAGALAKLKTAFEALEEKGEPEPPAVNFDDLNAAIDATGILNEDDYTAESWSNFQAALDAAKDVAANKDATQEQVDEALANLETAQEALDPKSDTPVVNKFPLAEAIAKAKATDTTGKTEESVAALNDAIKAAQAVVDDENATQEQVDEALAKLQAALEGLEDATEKPGGDDQKPGGDDQKPGGDTTKPGDDGQQGGSQQGGSQQGGSGQQGGGLAQTSDPTSFVAVLTTALAGAGALAISRKRR